MSSFTIISAVPPIPGHLIVADCFWPGHGTHTHDSGTVPGIPGQLVTLPYRRNITTLWLIWLSSPVMSCPFFSGTRPCRTAGPILTLFGSNDGFPRKKVLVRDRTMVTSFSGNIPQKTRMDGYPIRLSGFGSISTIRQNPPPVGFHVVGLVYNYRNSLSEDFTGDAKNVL